MRRFLALPPRDSQLPADSSVPERPGYYICTVHKRRLYKPPPCVDDVKTVYRLIEPLVRGADREHLYAIYLSSGSALIGIELVSVGIVDASFSHAREIFKGAIVHSAVGIVLAHNHPDGNPEPSDGDIRITKRLRNAGRFLGIPIVEHLVIGKGCCVSLKGRGVL